jgi:hypothetical protein
MNLIPLAKKFKSKTSINKNAPHEMSTYVITQFVSNRFSLVLFLLFRPIDTMKKQLKKISQT